MYVEVGAIFNSFYIPTLDSVDLFHKITHQLVNMFAGNAFLHIPPALPELSSRANDVDRYVPWRRLIDTRVLHFYTDDFVSDAVKQQLYSYADSIGIFVKIRDRNYCQAANEKIRPEYFICHDFKDKNSIAAPLAQKLSNSLGAIWYDEFSISPGESLRESIEHGIRECRQGILVVSPNFLANESWARNEFNALFTKELAEKKRVMVPVWCGVQPADVYEFSPALADRKGIQFTGDIEAIAAELVEVSKGRKRV